jgi:hypothetical protein
MKHNFSILHFSVWLFNRLIATNHPEAKRMQLMYKKPTRPILTNVPTGFLKYIGDKHDVGKFDTIRSVDLFMDHPGFLEKVKKKPGLNDKVRESPAAAVEELLKFIRKEAQKTEEKEREREEKLRAAQAAGIPPPIGQFAQFLNIFEPFC